ncbi:MAG TPA: hypothetical protein VH063_05775 [Gaiellaceae bacterium]|jgi:hypothetical protein|nr:hypothetical protein [Gaiellaceae bacterium]
MDAKRPWRRPPLRSFALGGVVGAAGTIATLRRLRRSQGGRIAAGLGAFEDAPCFREFAAEHRHDAPAAASEPD